MRITTADQRTHTRRHSRWQARQRKVKHWCCPNCAGMVEATSGKALRHKVEEHRCHE